MSIFYTCVHRSRYECQYEERNGLEQTCRGIRASTVDALISQQILAALEPAALELSIKAGEQIQRDRDRQVKHWRQQLERARYDCHQAERCYRAVDPENRLVARTLEQKWEQCLREYRQLEEEHERFLRQSPAALAPKERSSIQALASDIPALWHHPATTAQERKAIVRCLVEKVVLNVQDDTEYVDVAIHWAGGFVSVHQVQRPVAAYSQLRDIDRLMERLKQLHGAGYTAAQIAKQLGEEGFHPPRHPSGRFCKVVIRQIMSRLNLSSEWPKAVQLGPDEWWTRTLAKRLNMPEGTLHRWTRMGWIRHRRTPVHGFWILWADQNDLKRLERLRVQTKLCNRGPFAIELITPGGSTDSASPKNGKCKRSQKPRSEK